MSFANDNTNLTQQEIAASLNEQLSFDPIVETTNTAAQYDLTAKAVARKLGKSVRQIQRLLKAGQIKGYKVMSLKGEEWRIAPDQISLDNAFAQTELEQEKFVVRLAEVEAKLESVARQIQIVSIKIDTLVGDNARLANLLAEFKHTQSEIKSLKNQMTKNKSVVDELHLLREQQSVIDYVATEVQTHRQQLKELLEKPPSKAPWWKP